MTKGRIEAFSDGVFAIIITIMVLELRAPHGHEWVDFLPLVPIFLCYMLSFIYVGMFWNGHHQTFHAVRRIGGRVLWANLHFLFWLSLMPFVTGLIGENDFAPVTVFLYAADILMCSFAFQILTMALLKEHGKDSDFARALGSNRKAKLTTACFVVAVALSLVTPILALVVITLVAALWLVPDSRFAHIVKEI